MPLGVIGITVFCRLSVDSLETASLTGSRNTAMLKVLRALLSQSPPPDCAKKAAPKAMVKQAIAGKDYRAVSVAPGSKCCSSANAMVGKTYLSREAPRLPLVNCTMPTNCACKFKKASDRRDGDRRELGVSETGRWFAGPENRKRGGRRLGKD
jgi:hypothetical protein